MLDFRAGIAVNGRNGLEAWNNALFIHYPFILLEYSVGAENFSD
jgi:hypothetical protein